MRRAACVCLASLFLSATALSAELRGKLQLRDASNGDRTVGSAPQNGTPQGHTLKVTLQTLRFGRGAPAMAAVLADMDAPQPPVLYIPKGHPLEGLLPGMLASKGAWVIRG